MFLEIPIWHVEAPAQTLNPKPLIVEEPVEGSLKGIRGLFEGRPEGTSCLEFTDMWVWEAASNKASYWAPPVMGTTVSV